MIDSKPTRRGFLRFLGISVAVAAALPSVLLEAGEDLVLWRGPGVPAPGCLWLPIRFDGGEELILLAGDSEGGIDGLVERPGSWRLRGLQFEEVAHGPVHVQLVHLNAPAPTSDLFVDTIAAFGSMTGLSRYPEVPAGLVRLTLEWLPIQHDAKLRGWALAELPS